MKKIIALAFTVIMILSVALAASSCKKDPETLAAEDGSEITVIPAEETMSDNDGIEEAAHAPGSSAVYARGKLTLKEDPAFENGKLVLYFNEVLPYAEYKDSYIGIRSEYEAESVPSEPSLDDCKTMLNEDGSYIGIVLLPSYEIPAGTYDVFVSIGTYVVDTFTYTFD